MNPSLSDIKDATCAFYKSRRITKADLEGQARNRRIAQPRQIAMYLARALTTHSLPRIAHSFGGRHHTTALHSFRAVESREECLSDAEKIRQVLEARNAKWGEFSEELAAARAVGEFIRSTCPPPPPPPPVRNWLMLGTVE